MKRLVCLALLVSSLMPLRAAPVESVPEITTLRGRTYRDCRIRQVHPDGVSFIHANGAAKILFTDLPDSWKKKLGYNKQRAEEYEKELAARRFLERERREKARAEAAERQRQQLEIFERAAALQERQLFLQQQQFAASLSGGGFISPAPAVGWPGTYYGPLHTIHGPRFGGRPWARRGSVALTPYDGGYLGVGLADCGGWRGHRLGWRHGHASCFTKASPLVWHSPTLGSYIPGRFAPFGSAVPFGGVYLGGARNLGFGGMNVLGTPPAVAAPVMRGSVALPAP